MAGIAANVCGIHRCTADQCFSIHNPTAHRRGPENPDRFKKLKELERTGGRST